jgi:foldase protein PrsA
MSIHRPFFLLALLGAVAALAAGCGSSNSSSSDSGSNLGEDIVATVGDTNITQAQLDDMMVRTKSLYKARKTPFPAVGSPQYTQVQGRNVEFLVEREEFAQKAKALGVVVTAKQLDERIDQIKKQYFGGSEKAYLQALKQQGFTDEWLRDDQRAALVSEAVTAAVTKDAASNVSTSVSDSDIRTYYELHTQNYSKPQTRVVRHILVKTKPLADRLYKQAESGANFAVLAKKYTQDPGTKETGGELTITRGVTEKPFEAAAFALRTGQISKPVHTVYGWHIIKAEKPAVPRKVTPFDEVKAEIRQLLLQQNNAKVEQQRAKAVSDFLTTLKKEYCGGKLEFAKGFTPDPDPCASTK